MKDVLKYVVLGGLFLVPFLTLYVANEYFFPYITGKNFWFRIIIDVTFVAWILLALYDAKYRPKMSWIVGGFGALLVVMFFADLFGVHPRSSFWSNFERMDGYVSLLHTFMYMLMLGTVLTTRKHWYFLLNTSLAAAILVAIGGYAQYFDNGPILKMYNLTTGGGRIDSTLGNAAYMAIYMLFHIFIAFWLFVESKVRLHKIVYALLSIAFIFLLIETGTRGTAIGLAVGVAVMSGYIGLFGARFKEFRKYAIGAFVVLLIAVGAFIVGRDTEFVQNNSNLSRIANISFTDLTIRATIWSAALNGIAERPILGYGQSNFNYIFNEHYDPALYAQEQWFDRGHNIFIDWLSTGGILGLLAYLSIFAACGWYLFVRPILKKDDETFDVLERGVLLGILAGYFTHNLVVFDNIVSYIFFAVILGLIHARVGLPIPALEKFKIDSAIVNQFAAPVFGVLLIAVIYFVHMPAISAAQDIIKGFQAMQPKLVDGVRQPPEGPDAMLGYFKQAIDRDSFAHQEITEQLSQQTMNLVRSPNIPDETKQAFSEYTEEQLMRLIEEKPGDARIHVFVGSYYRSTNQIEKAAEQMAIARDLSPLKQSIMIQQGFIELQRNENEAANEFFKTAYELDTRNLEAKEYYAASLFYVGKNEEAIALMDSPETLRRFAKSDFMLAAANQAGETEFMLSLFNERLKENPQIAQNWATKAFLQYQSLQIEEAIATLNEGKEVVPSFAPTANCIIDNIENGRAPDEGC